MVYDVAVERVARVLKIARKYLTWVQNSVLEGELTRGQLARLKVELLEVIEEHQDSVVFYLFRSRDWMERETLGISKGEPQWFL